jgi:hypothetical protein
MFTVYSCYYTFCSFLPISSAAAAATSGTATHFCRALCKERHHLPSGLNESRQTGVGLKAKRTVPIAPQNNHQFKAQKQRHTSICTMRKGVKGIEIRQIVLPNLS